MVQKLKLTRNQLGGFLPDHESIKQFEKLFDLVEPLAPDFLNELTIAVGNANARATQANDLIEALTQLAELSVLSPPRTQEQKNQEVLAWLSMQ